jgi:alkylation response protein AidB-like acyl-CoA dehydrogenase
LNPATITTDASGHREMLRDSVADFVARGTDIARVRSLRGTPAEYDRGVWGKMAELGWLGVLVPEHYGGLGLGLAEAAIVADGLAQALVPEPLTAAAVLATGVLVGGDNEALKHELLPAVVAGEVLPALAWQEHAGMLDVAAITTRATPFEGGLRLNGQKRFIAGAAGADGYVVSANTAQGLELFWLARDTPGAALELEALADGRHFGVLRLADVVVSAENRLAGASNARAALEKALDHAMVIAGAELCGVMGRALDMSVDYMKTRVQFGKPIGSFQGLQHRAVDLFIQRQISSAVLDEALCALDQHPDPTARAAYASRVKARCSDAGLRITREAIQIHGAIGFTDEYDVGLYLKRAMVLAAWLGNAQEHRRRYARLVPPEFE